MSEGLVQISSTCKSVQGDPELHHNLLMLHTIVLHVPAWVLVDVEWVHYAEWQLVGLALARETTRLLHRDHLTIRVKFVEEVDEEFVEELADRCRVPLRSDILLRDHAKVILEKGICFDHAKDSRVRIASLTIAIVGSSSLFTLQLLNRHRIVDCLGLLGAQLAFLETR